MSLLKMIINKVTGLEKPILKILSLLLILSIVLSNCKESSRLNQKRFIYYGKNVKKNEIPWQVALFLKDSIPSKSSFCGGVIINKKWIVTAAHCFKFMHEDTLRIRRKEGVQIFSCSTSLIDSGGIVSNIRRLILHDDYNAIKRLNDIALIELNSPLDLEQEGQSKIYSPTFSEYEQFSIEGTDVVISGWGITDKEERSIKLQKATIPIANYERCRNNYFLENEIVTTNMICAGFDYGGADSCQGDSGGPLFTINQDNKPILIGIVSWGIGCSQDGLYGVYTNFFNYLSWIESYCPECIWGDIDL